MRIRTIHILMIAVLCALSLLTIRVIVMVPSQGRLDTLLASTWEDVFRGTISISAQSEMSLFPSPKLVLPSAQIKTADGTFISANRIVLKIGLGALIAGRYEVNSITISDCDILIPENFNPRDRANSEASLKAIVAYIDELKLQRSIQSVEKIYFQNVNLHFQNSQPDTSVFVEEGSIGFGDEGEINIDVKAAYRKFGFVAQIFAGPPDRAMQRERSIRFSYRDEQIEFSGNGVSATQPGIQFIGQVQLHSNDLNYMLERIFDQTNPALTTAAEMQAAARLSFSAMTFSKMEWTIGKTSLDGNMILDFTRGNPHITGTFAANTINLTEFLEQAGIKRDHLGEWSSEKFPKTLMTDLDLDLRISSDIVSIDDVDIKSVALSALLNQSNLELSLASGNLFNGSISGKVNITPQDGRGRQLVKASISINEIDLESALLKLIDSNRVSGFATSQINIQSEGQSSAELVGNLTGTIDIDASRVSFAGLNLLNFLHRVEQRPLGAGVALKSGSTAFDQAQASLVLNHGIANLIKVNFTKLPDLQIKLNGQIDLVNQIFSVSGHALGSSVNDANQSINLPFVLKGPFDNPAFLPDFVNVSKQTGPVLAD